MRCQLVSVELVAFTTQIIERPIKSAAVVGVKEVEGVTELEAEEGAPVPLAFVAVTVNVYAVPFVRPVTYAYVLAVAAVNPPGEDVTVYDVAPAEAVQLTYAR